MVVLIGEVRGHGKCRHCHRPMTLTFWPEMGDESWTHDENGSQYCPDSPTATPENEPEQGESRA